MELIVLLFSLFIVFLGIGITRIQKIRPATENTYSIVIACRNEEQNLPELFRSLENIIYPQNLYEIIIADDASTDHSTDLLQEFAQRSNNVSVVFLEKKDKFFKGKKAALKAAIDKAEKDILLFTDADCLPDKYWLSSYNNYFSETVAMVIGFSPELTNKSFRRFTQNINAGLYAATTGLGIPFSCTGRNFALKRAVFYQIGGYDSFSEEVAGDDKLLLNLIYKKKYKIAYNAEAPVFTKSPTNYLEQQKRRYSKFLQQRLPYQYLSILILLFYLYLPIQFYLHPLSAVYYLLAVVFFWTANINLHNLKFSLIDLFFCCIFPYFVILFSFWGTFSRWKWKT
jgi:poly-beta-1,6-N-acetyl-D-glucosamine synthase